MANVVEAILGDLMTDDGNRLWQDESEPAWDEPLVGSCRGDDPIFTRFKEVVGPIHWTPLDAYARAFPNDTVQADELAVFSWILPHTEKTKRDNRAETTLPSERWVRARMFGEGFNDFLRRHVAERLCNSGVPAVAPMRLPEFEAVRGGEYGRMSTWSERHNAYACGLGTFGLCDGLITPRGKAMRAGSVVAKVSVDPVERPYTDHHAYCLYFVKGTCGDCIERCPAEAIGPDGHDKDKCATYLDTATKPHVENSFAFKGYGCGLCQTGTPCESRIPKELA